MAQKRDRSKATPAPKRDDGTQLERVRGICLSIPNTLEKISQGAPTFFMPERVFAMFADNHHGDGHVAMWIPAGPGVQAALIEEEPLVYFRPPYVGVAGWVGVELSRVDDEQLSALIREAFRLIAVKNTVSNPRDVALKTERCHAAAGSCAKCYSSPGDVRSKLAEWPNGGVDLIGWRSRDSRRPNSRSAADLAD